MTHDELLTIFDREQRREIEFPNIRREVTPHTVRHVVPAGDPWGAFLSHSWLDENNVDAVIESEIAYFESLGWISSGRLTTTTPPRIWWRG